MRPLPAILLALVLPLPAAASAPPRVACGTARHLGEIRAHGPIQIAPAPAFGGVKAQRDAFGTFPNVRTSTNFALKWGPGATYSETLATKALEALELGWTVEMGTMAHPVPEGTDTYLLNVYIGNSGGVAPDINFAGAYASIDQQGHPYVVLSPDITEYFEMPGYEGYAGTTVVHELYHTVQFATGSFGANDAYWFWEATADWAAGEVYPDDESSYAFVGAWALYPHVPIDFADYADEGTLIELHQYGASIFPQFLTDEIADFTLVRDAWVSGGANGDPLEVLDGLLAAGGSDVRTAFADFSARLAFWDFPRGEQYEMWADYYADSYPNEDDRIAASVGRSGTSGWEKAPAATLPAAFGTNLVVLSPTDRVLSVAVEADAEGSAGSAGTLRAFVAVRNGSAVSYHPLVFDGRTGSVEVDGNVEALTLVVTPLPASDQGVDETFGYRFRVDAGGGGSNDRGCSAGGTRAGSLGLLVLALAPFAAILRRRTIRA